MVEGGKSAVMAIRAQKMLSQFCYSLSGPNTIYILWYQLRSKCGIIIGAAEITIGCRSSKPNKVDLTAQTEIH